MIPALGKILFLLIIAALVWLLFKGFFKAHARAAAPPPARLANGEDMVACARCGVNTPRSETREEGGKFYCANNPQCHP